jgi:Homeodomain-like domain
MGPRERYHDKAKTAPDQDNRAIACDQSEAPGDAAAQPEGAPIDVDAPPGERASLYGGLVDLIGVDAADELVVKFGGRRLYVPHLPQRGDVVTSALGEAAAQRLSRFFGGDRFEVPNPTPRRVLILQLRDAGMSVPAIARHLRCTRRRVFQVRAEARVAQSGQN